MMDWSRLSPIVGKGEAHRPLRACGRGFLPAYWRSGLKSSEPNVAQRARYGNEKTVCKRDAGSGGGWVRNRRFWLPTPPGRPWQSGRAKLLG